MLKIAVLILSNRTPSALAMHEEYWRGFGDLYIHVDVNADKSSLRNLVNACVIIPSKLYWGGWSMVVATMNLIRRAMHEGHYDRFLLISDDSSPLIPVREMVHRLSERREYIWIWSETQHRFMDRYSNYYFLDHPATAISPSGFEGRIIDGPFLEAMKDVALLKSIGKKPIAFRHGSQWWALSHKAISKILHAYTNDKWLTESFRFSGVPDEQFFHTVIEELWQENFLYTERRQPEMPNTFRSLSEIQKHTPEGFMFARKVDCDVPEVAELIRTGNLKA